MNVNKDFLGIPEEFTCHKFKQRLFK